MTIIHNVFYNANYNEGSPDGRYRYCWGVKSIDFDKNLQAQICPDMEVFNFNLTSLSVLRSSEVNAVESVNQELLGALRVAVDTAYMCDVNGSIDEGCRVDFFNAEELLHELEAEQERIV